MKAAHRYTGSRRESNWLGDKKANCRGCKSMNRYIAELLGTFVLVFASCGSAVLAGDKIGFLGVSLAFGLSLLAMSYAIGPISGCHIIPP